MDPGILVHTLRQLEAVDLYASHSEQHDALRECRLVLYFILARHEEGELKQFLTSSSMRPRTSSLSFPTKEDADIWLHSHPAPPHGAYVEAAKAPYHVAYVRELKHRKLLPLPTEEEWARMEEEPEDTIEEGLDLPPPKPSPEFNLFGLYKYVCFHLHKMEQRMSSPEELEALRVAKLSFDFVMESGEYHGFEEYLETLRASRTSPPVQSFSTREEANSWLATQPEPPAPAVVSIGHELYSVGYHRLRGQRVLLRLPTPQEIDTGAP